MPDTVPVVPVAPDLRTLQEAAEDGFDQGRLFRELRFLALAAFVGVASGLGVSAFKISVSLVNSSLYVLTTGQANMPEAVHVLSGAGGFEGVGIGRLEAALIPALGGVLVSILRAAGGGFGGGVNDFANQVEKGRDFPGGKQLLKILASVAALGTGNSLGPEGPAVEIGASCARSSMAASLGIDKRRKLLLCGCSAGVAAGFNAPLAGVFFSLEVVQELLPSVGPRLRTGIASLLLSSVVSSLTANLVLNEGLALRPAPYELGSVPALLPLFVGLGLASGGVALVFKAMLNEFPKIWDEPEESLPGPVGSAADSLRQLPVEARPAIFGLFCGFVGLFFPQVLFFGYETLDGIISAGAAAEPALYLLLILGLKAMLTAGSLAFGLVGGTFAPALFLGAVLGSAYQQITYGALEAATAALPAGTFAATTFSDLLAGDSLPAFALVGAASVLAALFRAPLTALLLLFELTRDYNIVITAAASAGVASLVSEIWRQREDLKEAEAARGKGKGRFQPDEMGVSLYEDPSLLLALVSVEEVMLSEPLVLSPDDTLVSAINAFETSRAYHALVVDRDGSPSAKSLRLGGRFVGIISLGGLSRAIEGTDVATDASRCIRDACLPRDKCITIKASESAGRARELLTNLRMVPVVADANPDEVLGIVDEQSLRVGQKLSSISTTRANKLP